MNVTNEKVNVVVTITIHVGMRDFTVRVAFRIVPSLAVTMFLEIFFMHRFAKGIFSPRMRNIQYNVKQIIILTIKNMTEEPKYKGKWQGTE